MKKMSCLIAFSAVALFAQLLSADVVLYDGSTGDDFFANGGFTFDDFVVTDTGSSLEILADTDADGNNGFFGGLGRNVDPVEDFDANTTTAKITYCFLPTNQATNFRLVLSDFDDADSAEDFQYFIDPSFATDLGGGLLEQTLNIDQGSSVFSGTSFGFADSGDGIANFGLRQWQIQSEFGSSDILHVEIKSIVLETAVPEPGSASLIGLIGLTCLARRKRN